MISTFHWLIGRHEVNLRLGLIGNGAIARALADHCRASDGKLNIAAVLGRRRGDNPAGNYPLVETVDDFVGADLDLVIECAGHEAVRQYGARTLEAGLSLIIASVGALHDQATHDALRRAEHRGHSQLIFTPGALVGLESLVTVAMGRLDAVSLHSSKPPEAWRGTQAETSFDLGRLEAPTVIFEGTAREAARRFPKNANVAASVALFGIGFDRTHVILVADPKARTNRHVLEARGAFGTFKAEIEAEPLPGNPKTSMMAALSIIKCVEMLAASLDFQGSASKGRGNNAMRHLDRVRRC